jgi:hypothetical protein
VLLPDGRWMFLGWTDLPKIGKNWTKISAGHYQSLP